ncbi:MAG: alcohol dehydrogenase catalytic domain-containing protein [Solirubrobacterales bacterium]|nr:alcohol dehydrogenase catalytic domain-containing protein [Solirubrobacterales bacterium]
MRWQTVRARRRVTLCRCGHSEIKPRCDGTHRAIAFREWATHDSATASLPPDFALILFPRAGILASSSPTTGGGTAMRAVAVFPQARSIEVVDHTAPERRASTEVLAKVLEVGVCGTDREIARFEYGIPPDGDEYLVIGHESLAEVVEVGDDVDGLAPGDLVVTMVRRACGRPDCRPCRAGRQDFCVTGDYTERGIKGRHGFMTDQLVDDARFIVKVPAELRKVGVLTEPLTIAQKALEELWHAQDRLPWIDAGAAPDARGRGHRAVVLGAGPVGLLGAMALLEAGFDTTIYSRSPAPNPKADLATAIGVRYVSSSEHDLDELIQIAGRPDVIYEAAGVADVAMDVLQALGPNGVFVFTGVPGPEQAKPLDASALMRRMVLGNQLILGTVNAGRGAYESAVASLGAFHRRWPSELAALITKRHALEEAPGLLTNSSHGIKDVVALDGLS